MILTLLVATALADALPPPNFPHGGQQEHSEVQPGFGADISIGYAQGFMTSPWIEKGGYGVILGRYEAFAQDRNSAGPRIGASIWASQTVGPKATATEPIASGRTEEIEVEMSHYGALAVIRHDPEAPVGGTMGFGFGRAQFEDYYDGPLPLPVLTFEVGARHRATGNAFIDWMARAHWATGRSAVDSSIDEWWMVQLAVLVGFHAN